MKHIPEVGDTVMVKEYCFANKYGGTEVNIGSIRCIIVKAWHDYECGWRYWAKPEDPNLLSSLQSPRDVIFVSQFDVLMEVR